MGGELDAKALAKVGRVLRLMAHPMRLRMLLFLQDHGPAPVYEVVSALGLAQGATSQHLSLLRGAGIVEGQRRGREVWYDVADRRCLSVLGCVREKGGKG